MVSFLLLLLIESILLFLFPLKAWARLSPGLRALAACLAPLEGRRLPGGTGVPVRALTAPGPCVSSDGCSGFAVMSEVALCKASASQEPLSGTMQQGWDTACGFGGHCMPRFHFPRWYRSFGLSWYLCPDYFFFPQPDSLLRAVTFSLGDGSELVANVLQPVVPL